MAVATHSLVISQGCIWSYYYTTPSFITDPFLYDYTYNTEFSGNYMVTMGNYLFKSRGNEMSMSVGLSAFSAIGTDVYFYDGTSEITNLIKWNGGIVVATENSLTWMTYQLWNT